MVNVHKLLFESYFVKLHGFTYWPNVAALAERELRPLCYLSCWTKPKARGVLEAACSGNSPALTANPEINPISEMNYRTSWQRITETWEHV